jgi:hypothetical protein
VHASQDRRDAAAVNDEFANDRNRLRTSGQWSGGHVHEGYGVYQTAFGTTVVNASVCNARYQPVNPAITIEW